jgi:hypothetical protein
VHAFQEALCVLPPEGWVRKGGQESFKCMEHSCGNITNIYAYDGERYWNLMDSADLSHEAVMELIKSACNKIHLGVDKS